MILVLLLAGLALLPALRQYYPAEPGAIFYVSGSPQLVALTFETLWSSRDLERLLAILEEEEAGATFFISGTWLQHNPEAAQLILNKGFEIGNHTFSHRNLLYLNQAEIDAEIGGFNELCRELLEYRPRLFRPALGMYNGMILKQAEMHRLQTVLWSVESYDTISESSAAIVERVMGRIHGGAVIVFRAGAPHLPEALPELLSAMAAQGYRAVSASELLDAGG